ncbi:Chloroperoxidase [Mycena metata]|uniref:Chloroperoxidase n=1 Tax=Mycena metata TaxID=1033252 RepID=A0AAD7ISG6_9AGAR|nr:Chloroperoxidase [Mycena metata]
MLFTGAGKLLENVYIFSWDVCLTLLNLVTPNKKVGSVIPHGSPGAGGKWPEFVPPGEGDSRSCCPALNAMANHGILPHDGRNIKFTDMNKAVRATYNFAPTFCLFVPTFMAGLLKKNYKTDMCDLAEINLHNGIEHDASLTRQDAKYDPDQDKPYLPFIHELLASATGKDKDGNPMLTAADLSRYSGKRRSEAKATNPDYSLDKFHKMFGSSNSSTLLTIFGGKLGDLESLLVEERIPQGWEPRILARKGLTFLTFNRTVLKVENAIKEESVGPVQSNDTAPLI